MIEYWNTAKGDTLLGDKFKESIFQSVNFMT